MYLHMTVAFYVPVVYQEEAATCFPLERGVGEQSLLWMCCHSDHRFRQILGKHWR